MMNQTYFITGIGTDVGKTVVSAIFCEALEASYWKPVQAGDLENSDSIKISKLCSSHVQVLPERYRLKTPASPHYAAELDGIKIEENDFILPEVTNPLIIEGAGGLMVPLNEDGLLFFDLLKKWKIPVILVSRHYLGSINHTLLSLELMKHHHIPVELVVFVGDENKATEQVITKLFPEIRNYRIQLADEVNHEFIKKEAEKFAKIQPI